MRSRYMKPAARLAAAIARLACNPLPHAIVTDFRMPHADGMAVAQFARSRSRESSARRSRSSTSTFR